MADQLIGRQALGRKDWDCNIRGLCMSCQDFRLPALNAKMTRWTNLPAFLNIWIEWQWRKRIFSAARQHIWSATLSLCILRNELNRQEYVGEDCSPAIHRQIQRCKMVVQSPSFSRMEASSILLPCRCLVVLIRTDVSNFSAEWVNHLGLRNVGSVGVSSVQGGRSPRRRWDDLVGLNWGNKRIPDRFFAGNFNVVDGFHGFCEEMLYQCCLGANP